MKRYEYNEILECLSSIMKHQKNIVSLKLCLESDFCFSLFFFKQNFRYFNASKAYQFLEILQERVPNLKTFAFFLLNWSEFFFLFSLYFNFNLILETKKMKSFWGKF